jgi:flagellar motor switch protein FliN
MSTPQEIIAELLSGEQAETLSRAGRVGWQAAVAALTGVLGIAPGLEDVQGRLVMPDEISGDFVDPHLVAPITLTANSNTVSAYLVAALEEAAAFIGVDPQQQDQLLATLSVALIQAAEAINTGPLAGLPGVPSLGVGELARDGMPALLSTMDEPALALTGTLRGGTTLDLTFLFPATFLDMLAGVFPAEAADTGDLPFTLTQEELDAAGLIDELPPLEPQVSVAPLEPRMAPPLQEPQPLSAPPPLRQPTPISSAPAALRARFAPLPDPEPSVSRHAIDLISALEMNVSVELGRTEMTISEVLALGPGSVIELDRLSGEPVDILVNDRLIARGEVVVVDENFGVRVVEVVRRGVQAEERAN